jgi:hypothetical protein
MVDWTPISLVVVGAMVFAQDRLRARDARRARNEQYLTAIDQGQKLDTITATTDTTHRIVNNDHTKLVGRLVDALDKLGDPVTDSERTEAAKPLTEEGS